MKALELTAYGNPKDVIRLVDQPEFGPLAADEWVIDMEAAPVSPTDQYIIAGIYGELPPLPHGLGSEGVGRVSAVGSAVRHLKVGDRVIAPLLQNTTWSTRVKTRETWQRALPEGNLSQMAQVGMNPAHRTSVVDRIQDFKGRQLGDLDLREFGGRSLGHPDCKGARHQNRQHRSHT